MTRVKRACWYVVMFAIPYGGVLCAAVYNRMEPGLFGIPFFYWYQFVWIMVTAVITALAYFNKV
jgi:Protein of unknown function (DUF3311)